MEHLCSSDHISCTRLQGKPDKFQTCRKGQFTGGIDTLLWKDVRLVSSSAVLLPWLTLYSRLTG
ncbi:hypothetical protein EVAR_72614_1, partial [Eumeta japonica]